MTALTLFDFAESQAAAKRGMDLTLDAQPLTWTVAYEIHAEKFLQNNVGKRFTGENLREYLEPIIGAASSPNAWGAKFRHMLAGSKKVPGWVPLGRVVRVGSSNMTCVTSHARETPLYEVVG